MSLCVNIQWVRRWLAFYVVLVFAFVATANADSANCKSGNEVVDTVTVCGVFTWHDSIYTESGTYSDTLTASDGTDSVVWLHLTVLPVSYGVDSVTACDLYEWPANGVLYRFSTDTSALLVAANDCDSIVTLHLEISYSDTVSDTLIHVCGDSSYTWFANDSTYSKSGSYVWRIPNSTGCDSVWMLSLHVHDSSDYYVYDTCRYNQLPWSYGERVYYEKTEDDVFNLVDSYGCDSIVHYFLQPIWECDAFLQFPSVVTPNGDGVNDRFVISNLIDEGCYPHNRLTIYNRWGFMLYDRKNIQNDDEFWDADGVPAGTYFFRFEGYGFSDKAERHGSFEIIK